MAEVDKDMILSELRAALDCGGDDFKKVHTQAVRDAITLIERLTRPINYGSEEGFAVRTLREAAERGFHVLIESERGSYMARLHSDAVLSILENVTLSEKEAGVG